MKFDRKTYPEYTKRHAPRSPTAKNTFLAFVTGGCICAAGQGLKESYLVLTGDEKTSGTLVSVTLIFLSCLFTSLGLYDRLAKHAGAGTLVPITGFANACMSPALDNKSEGWISGLGAKTFIISGPVILYGTAAGVIYGVVLWILGLIGAK
ncbi:MAG: SpoVA/SpoVAEb family sporulation membrane protein [Clostridia bacterium]|nr:SpoVA/SpoVAEb family sporulation membrane protein [Clostridia bacterium]